MNKRITGAGVGFGVLLAAPASAHAGDFTVSNLNDSGAGSLREAVEDAAISMDPEDRILFNSKLSGQITLTSGEMEINGPLQILGPGPRRVAVSGNHASRIFNIQTAPGDDVGISGLSLIDADSGTGDGGAIYAYDADLTLANSTLSGNQAGSQQTDGGGALYLGSGSITIRNSTISGNRANQIGGGVSTYDSALTIENSTISGNESTGACCAGAYGGTEVLVRNSTIANNTAGTFGGGLGVYSADVVLRGALIADNSAPEGADLFDDLDNSTFEGSSNLIEDPGNVDPFGTGNILGVDPKLKPLKDNGGPTDTHAFKKSPVKNKVPKSETPKSDQRGAKRKGKGDIGAYELVKCEGVIVNRVGTAGKDKLKGTKKKDGILGLGGNDKLKGKKGKDGLCGGSGKDKLIGGPGKDKLNGGPGKDKEIQ
jgi:hypothetical protein